MILKELSSDIKNFHKIEFKRGLNFIVGRRKSDKSSDTDSYNGVGKSLIIELIHFCFGSNKVQGFSILGHHYCKLKFEHNYEVYEVKRYLDGGQEIFLNGENINQIKFRNKMYEICFSSLGKTENVGFRSLISRYIRRYKANYTSYYSYVKGEQKQVELLNNAIVLGLKPENIVSKIKNKEKYTILKSTKKSLESDDLLIDYFKGNTSIDFKLKDLNEKLQNLQEKKSSFKIAENYYDLKKQADELSEYIRKLNNQKFILKNRIVRIDSMLNKKIQVTNEDVINLYNEVGLIIKDGISKKIEDLINFNMKLSVNRKNSYLSQKHEYESRLIQIIEEIEENDIKLSKMLKILHESGALEDYNKLCNEITDLNKAIEKMTDYKSLMKKYEKEITLSKKKKAEITLANQIYLEDNQCLFNELMDMFRKYSRQFYKDKPSGLSVQLNSKDNKLAYNIEADIEGDSSDGINEVKIFCFDMTVLMKKTFDIQFLFHDSRLLSNMDPRQRNVWMKIINEEFGNNPNLQYISSINEDVLVTMKDVANEETRLLIDKVFSKENIRLELNDDCPESKLLGVQVNISYDK